MAEASGQLFGLGQRGAFIIEIDQSTGLPKATSASVPYEGLPVSGNRQFDMTIPPPREFTHVGQDRPLAVDFLPAATAMTGVLTASAEDFDIQALVDGTIKKAIGEMVEVPIMSSNQGFEPQVGLFLFQQAEDFLTGLRRWRTIMITSARLKYMNSSMSEGLADVKYQVSPSISTLHPWGTAWDKATEGCVSAQAGQIMSEGIPVFCAWKGDGVAVDFPLPTGKPLLTEAKAKLWVNGVLDATADFDIIGELVTPTTMPTAGQIVVALYETSATL